MSEVAVAAYLDKLDALTIPEPNSGCHLFMGTWSEGYGRISVWVDGRNVAIYAHRLAYERVHGLIPMGLQPDHKCRIRPCVNEAHLELVTGRENTLRGEAPSAENARRTHCKLGHALVGENVRMRGSRFERICRICDRLREAKYRQQRRRRRSQSVPEPS